MMHLHPSVAYRIRTFFASHPAAGAPSEAADLLTRHVEGAALAHRHLALKKGPAMRRTCRAPVNLGVRVGHYCSAS